MKEFVLKKSPILKIILNVDDFEIINQQYEREAGRFKYSNVDRIEFKEERVDYSNSLLLFLLSLIISSKSKTAKKKERISINYSGQQLNIILFNYDKELTLQAIEEIENRIN